MNWSLCPGGGPRARLGVCAAVLIAASTQACTGPQAVGADKAPATLSGTGPGLAPEIRNGTGVNNHDDPISSLFPLSTVWLTNSKGWCTGTILSSTKILTAAHCGMDSTTVIHLYSTQGDTPVTTIGGSSMGITINIWDPTKKPVDVPGGITPTNLKDANGNWADLAILNLAENALPNDTPWVAAAVTPSGSYPLLQTGPNSSWAVGAGREAGQSNPTGIMQYQATDLLSINDVPGWFATKTLVTDLGDSGGPLYQLGPSPAGGGLGNLIVVGVSSLLVGLAGLLPTQTGSSGFLSTSVYTSVAYDVNAQWIQSELGPATTTPQKMMSDYFKNHRPRAGELVPVGNGEGWRVAGDNEAAPSEASSASQ